MIESRLAATRAADPLPIVSEAGKPEVAIEPSAVQHGFAILSSVNHSPILLGTSSFTATGWQGSFYPKGLRPADYLSVEVLRVVAEVVGRSQALRVERSLPSCGCERRGPKPNVSHRPAILHRRS